MKQNNKLNIRLLFRQLKDLKNMKMLLLFGNWKVALKVLNCYTVTTFMDSIILLERIITVCLTYVISKQVFTLRC